MSTVDKDTVDSVIAGEYPEDDVRIIGKYTNAWGATSYKLFYGDNARQMFDAFMYTPNEFVINPELYWTPEQGVIGNE